MNAFVPLLVIRALHQSADTALLSRALADLRLHPVEIVAKDTVSTTVRAHAFLDINDDGRAEVFLAISPKYRQSATVVVYRWLDGNRIERLYEGLAPGQLVSVSGKQVDTHTLGNGIDMSVEGGADSARTLRVILAARLHGMQIVRYPSFFHVDERSKAAGYVDMASAAAKLQANTCVSFEFAPVQALASGKVGSDTVRPYLVVLTPTEIVFYRFFGITPDGLLEKSTWSEQRPNALSTIGVAKDGFVVGTMSDGHRTTLALPP